MTTPSSDKTFITITTTSPSPKCSACQGGSRRYVETFRQNGALGKQFRHLIRNDQGKGQFIQCEDQRESAPDLTQRF